MELKGDGNGIVTIPLAQATGDFSLVFSDLEITDPANAEIIMGLYADGRHFVATFAGALLKARLDGGATSVVYSGSAGQRVGYEIKREGIAVSYYIDGVLIGSENKTETFSLDTFFSYNNGAFIYRGSLSGSLRMVGFTSPTQAGTPERLYDFAGSGTTLIDTISAENGTLSGFTSGGFTAPGSSITITSVSDHESRQRDINGQAVFTIGGDITGSVTSIEYRLDGGTWQVLDASPTTKYSGTVIVTNEQDVSVRISNDAGITATVVKLKAAACIVIGPAQSNAVSRIINAQTYTVDSGKPTPSMYKDGVFTALSDPSGLYSDGVNDGSLWPYIAKQYSDLGIPVCIGNVARGGTSILVWTEGGGYYGRIEQFATACGGIEYAVALIGETDSANGTSTVDFKARYVNVATSLNTNYGCDMYAVYFPVGTNTGTTVNVDAVRLGIDQAIDENAFIKFGGDLSVIDISSATNGLNDNLHIKTDADAVTASAIVYDAITSVSSTLNITVSGMPDGSYMTVLDDEAGTRLTRQNETYTSGLLSVALPLAVGIRVKGYVDDTLNPSVNGSYLEGVTV